MKNSSGVVAFSDFIGRKPSTDISPRPHQASIANDTGNVEIISGSSFDKQSRMSIGGTPNLFQETGMVRDWLAAGESVASRCFLYR